LIEQLNLTKDETSILSMRLPAVDEMMKPKFHLARHVTSRHDTTCSTCRAHALWLCRACRTARLDTLVSTRSTRNVTSQVEFGLNRSTVSRCWWCRRRTTSRTSSGYLDSMFPSPISRLWFRRRVGRTAGRSTSRRSTPA